MKKRKLSLLLVLTAGALICALTVSAFADVEDTRTKIMEIEATAVGIDEETIEYGAPVPDPKNDVSFTVTKGQPAYISTYLGEWQRKEGDKWEDFKGKFFSEGTYRYQCYVDVNKHYGDDKDFEKYVLGRGCSVTVNGESWGSLPPEDMYLDTGISDTEPVVYSRSFSWLNSPEYEVEYKAGVEFQFAPPTGLTVLNRQKGRNIVGYAVSLDLSPYVSGGTPPYSFTMEEGPSWLSLSEDGIVSGTPSEVNAGTQAPIKIKVTDSSSPAASKELSLPVSSVHIQINEINITSPELQELSDNGIVSYETTLPEVTVTPSDLKLELGSFYFWGNWPTQPQWSKKGSDTPVNIGDKFTDGTYNLDFSLKVKAEYSDSYEFADKPVLKINGVEWKNPGNEETKYFTLGMYNNRMYCHAPVYEVSHVHVPSRIEGQPAPSNCTETPGWPAFYQCAVCGRFFEDEECTIEIPDLIYWEQHNPHPLYGEHKGIVTVNGIPGVYSCLPSTCTEPGYKPVYYCEDCGKYFSDGQGLNEIGDEAALELWKAEGGEGYEAPLGHDLEVLPGKLPTCTEPGFKTAFHCKRLSCGKYFSDEECLHEIGDEAALEAWRAEGGEGYSDPLGHLLSEIEGKEPSCTEAGYKHCYKCARCNRFFSDSEGLNEIADIDAFRAEGGDGYLAAAHQAVKIEGREATASEPGWKDYYKCEACSKYFEDEDCTSEIVDLEAWKTGAGRIEIESGEAKSEEIPKTADSGESELILSVIAASLVCGGGAFAAGLKKKKV